MFVKSCENLSHADAREFERAYETSKIWRKCEMSLKRSVKIASSHNNFVIDQCWVSVQISISWSLMMRELRAFKVKESQTQTRLQSISDSQKKTAHRAELTILISAAQSYKTR